MKINYQSLIQTLLSVFVAFFTAILVNNYYIPQQNEKNYQKQITNELYKETSKLYADVELFNERTLGKIRIIETNTDSLNSVLRDKEKVYQDIKRLYFKLQSYGTPHLLPLHDEYLRDFLYAYALIDKKSSISYLMNNNSSNEPENIDLFYTLRDIYFQKLHILSKITKQLYREELNITVNEDFNRLIQERSKLDSLIFKSL